MEQRLGRGFQFGIPLFSEAPDKRVFEELIESQVKFFSFSHSSMAHTPTMVIDACESVGKTFFADRVEIARNGF